MIYMGQEISVEFPCDVYKSMDDAGEFNYFFLRDDTMEETGHIEFRYGKDLLPYELPSLHQNGQTPPLLRDCSPPCGPSQSDPRRNES